MSTRFAVSVLIVLILSMLLGVLIHGITLGGDYTRLAERGIYRGQEEPDELLLCMIAANLLFAVGFTWIYRAGRDARPWLGQGVRFGTAVAVMSARP